MHPGGTAAFLPPGFDDWRAAARSFLLQCVSPDEALWHEDQFSLIDHSVPAALTPVESVPPLRVPRDFMRLALSVACHRAAERWDLLYRLLWRILHGERELLSVATDPLVHRALVFDKAVRRAAHKMKAFVRFRRVTHTPNDASEPLYVAWFEPAHRVLERTAPFFARRFQGMRWSIATPERCAHWNGERVTFTPGVNAHEALGTDALEDLWREYYANVFNPARLAPGVMRAEMPKTYWKNLPEARLIPELTRSAPARVAAMIERVTAPALPLPHELRSVEAPVSSLGRPRRTAAVTRPAPLDFPSWDPVHDPGVEVARERAERVAPGSAKITLVNGVHVMPGVAGWTDPTLLAPDVFYPPEASTPEDRLRFYAARYAMVEVDSTYYALPRRENSVAWVKRTPADFIFNVKAHALMTGHGADVRRLPDWLRASLPARLRQATRIYGRELSEGQRDELWERYLSALRPLVDAQKLGAVFLQFPRWFEPGPGAERVLMAAARRLGDVRGAIEFRNPDWVTGAHGERTFGLLRDCSLAYTVVDAPPGTRSSVPPVVRVTRPDFAVVRLHGRRVDRWEARNSFVTERYRYLYTRRQVADWAEQVRYMAHLMGSGMLQVSYNNNHANYSTTNGLEFGEELASPRERFRAQREQYGV